MVHQTDAVVVGGGATGTGVARDLAMRGVAVTLVERGPLTAGTTGRSHGLLHSGARYADDDPVGARECIRENRVLREIGGACVAETGGYVVQLDDESDEYFDRKLDACVECGIPATEVDARAARADAPGLATDAARAIRVPDAVIYPSRLVAATAADARKHGARVLTHAEVEDVTVEDGRVVGVELDGPEAPSRIEADHVVNAAGPWAGEVAAMAGVRVEMRPTKGVMCVFDYPDLESVLNRCRPPSDGDIVVPHADAAVVGTTSVDVGDPGAASGTDWETERLLLQGRELLPDLDRADLRRSYCGVRPLYAPAERGGGRAISRDSDLLRHGDRDGLAGFTTVVGGKLTTYRLMAEAVADAVCEDLGVDAACRTADEPLPGADDPERLDALVREFGGPQPADADVVSVE